MSKAHYMMPVATTPSVNVVRLGAGNTTSDNFDTKEENKFIKLVAESRYDLCAAGDPIEGIIYSVEPATAGGYSIGGRVNTGMLKVLADGLEATPGTGTIAVGDYVVCGSVTAKGTANPSFPKVCKATNQPTATVVSVVPTDDTAAAVKVSVDAVLVKLADATVNALHGWRVVSLGPVGTGAVGTEIVIERV